MYYTYHNCVNNISSELQVVLPLVSNTRGYSIVLDLHRLAHAILLSCKPLKVKGQVSKYL